MKEIIDSIKNIAKERLANPIYGTFLISWLIFHWEFVYTLLFVDQDIIWNSKLLFKNDYLIQEFFNFKDPFFYILWSIPFILTYLVIWKFPKWFLLSGYTEEEKYKTDKSLVKLKEAVKIKKEEAKLEEENAKELKALAEKKQSEKIIEDTDPTIKWEKEYQALKRRNNFYQFQQIYDIIYNNGGSVYGNQLYIAAKPLIAYLDNTNIVNFDGSNIELTEKGKYFMKRFLEEK